MGRETIGLVPFHGIDAQVIEDRHQCIAKKGDQSELVSSFHISS